MQSLRAAWQTLLRAITPGRLAAVLVVLLAGVTVVVAIDIDGDGQADKTVTIHVDGPDRDTKRDDPLVLDTKAQVELERVTEDEDGELADPLREPTDEAPAGVLEGPLAAQEFPGCRTRFVRNYSTRAGRTPQVITWHQTVSFDRPGWADQDGLTAMANRLSSGVSWHFLIGRVDGYCTFSVPLHMKAWTQGNANPVAIGIEVQAYGTEPTYVTGAGERKLLAVTRELGRRYRIPMRHGKVTFDSSCRPTVIRKGIVEHSELGRCGGGHADVTPWSTGALIRKLQPPAITKTDRATCRKLTWWRMNGRPHGLPERRAVARRKALEARRLSCVNGRVRRA